MGGGTIDLLGYRYVFGEEFCLGAFEQGFWVCLFSLGVVGLVHLPRVSFDFGWGVSCLPFSEGGVILLYRLWV